MCVYCTRVHIYVACRVCTHVLLCDACVYGMFKWGVYGTWLHVCCLLYVHMSVLCGVCVYDVHMVCVCVCVCEGRWDDPDRSE